MSSFQDGKEEKRSTSKREGGLLSSFLGGDASDLQSNHDNDEQSINGGRNRGTLFCLCITAGLLSAPLNGLSPSLSLVAKDMGFNDRERDIYLGGYVALSTMIGQMIGSCLAGFLVDSCKRKTLLIYCLAAGSLAAGFFGILNHYPTLLLLRVVTGGCQGVIVPVLFSLIGDYYSSEERASNSAIVSSCLGGGMMLGQLFTGYSLPYIGWRVPFIVMGVLAMLAILVLKYVLMEPLRGAREDVLAELLSRGMTLPPLSTARFIDSMCIPTVTVMVLQTIPNTIPWGVLSAHLHDLLATDAGLPMEEATSLIAIFGAGAALGGLFGGYLGAKIYSSNRMMLPMFMGLTVGISALLMKELLLMNLHVPGAINLAFPVLIVSGALAAVNGANIRVIILNLTSPEARGATIAVLNFVNCMGRGVGPSLIELWMASTGIERKAAVSTFLNLWLVSGSLLCIACSTIARDEDRMKSSLKKLAEGLHHQNYHKGDGESSSSSSSITNGAGGSSGSSSSGIGIIGRTTSKIFFELDGVT